MAMVGSRESTGQGFTGALVMSLMAALHLATLLAPALAQSTQEPFKAYPPPDFCGYPRPPGVPPLPPSKGPQSCPMDVCPSERNDCSAADEVRKQCLRRGCNPAVMEAATANATEKCRAATECVRDACASVKQLNGRGPPCRVRTYMGGQCCCPTCRPKIVVDDVDGPFFTGTLGENSVAVADNRWMGMLTGECAFINSQEDLSEIVIGQGGAKVYKICSSDVAAPFNYKVWAEGEGGGGLGMVVTLVDNQRHEYKIPVQGEGRTVHETGFNLDYRPNFLEVRWNNIQP